MRRYTFGVLVLLASGVATAAEKELHVVALYEGNAVFRDRVLVHTAKVTVDRPGKEVVLLVSANEAVEWEITATPKTKLTKVIFGGAKRQSWKLPHGVTPDEMSVEAEKQRILPTSLVADHRPDSVRFRLFVRANREYTGLEIASFHGAYRFDPTTPFVVDAIQKDERLNSDFPKLSPAAQVPKFKMEATRVVYGERRETWSFGAFTEAGPASDGFKRLPDRVRTLAYVPKGKFHYGILDHDFFKTDMKGGTVSKIPRPDDNFSWPQSLTYDAKRDRVLIATRRDLYEYTPKNGGAWAQLVNDRYRALVWQPKTDTLFAFRVEQDPGQDKLIPVLYELNVNGAVAKSTALGSPLFSGILGDHGMRGHAQLIDLGGDLALLVHSENRDPDSGRRGKPETFLYVINPKSGKVVLTWKE